MTLKPSREILFPFRIGQHGGIAFTVDPYQQAFQKILINILTSPGERVMVPQYGTPARSYVFENIDDITAAELGVRIEQAVNRWDPGIRIISITPETTFESEGTLRFQIRFNVPPQQEVRTAVIDAGGAITGEPNV